MSLETLFVSGPSTGGKSTVARMIADHALDRPAHYIRMQRAADRHTNAIVEMEPGTDDPPSNGWSSMHAVRYTSDRVFETLPDTLRTVRRLDRNGFTIIEADSDPALRHAYPYDYRVFVMCAPPDLATVFRTPEGAAVALQQVMQDTASFASEIFGLFDATGLDDSVGVEHELPRPSLGPAPAVENLSVGESQIRHFVSSPLGAEIASRIQLQPEFHALVESDVVVINTGATSDEETLDECVRRVEKLLARVRHDARRQSVLYWGDIQDTDDPIRYKLLRRFRTLFAL